MKSVLISIQPKWCELIANGTKTIEVRKTKPKLETPFKVYIYCTNNGGSLHMGYGGVHYHKSNIGKNDSSCINGKVIGEFVCDKIIDIDYGIEEGVYFDGEYQEGFETNGNGNNPTCLSFTDLENYLTENEGYGWHISYLVIYDKPIELREFSSGSSRLEFSNTEDGFPLKWSGMKRPPQSWCYVESEVSE